jgi:hypothetical protein
LSEFWQAIICQRRRQAMAGHTLTASSAAAAVSSGHSIDFIVIPLLSFDESFQYHHSHSW